MTNHTDSSVVVADPCPDGLVLDLDNKAIVPESVIVAAVSKKEKRKLQK